MVSPLPLFYKVSVAAFRGNAASCIIKWKIIGWWDVLKAISTRKVLAYYHLFLKKELWWLNKQTKRIYIYWGAKPNYSTCFHFSIKYFQVIAETNQGYVNSEIPIRARLHCIAESDIQDGQDSSETLSQFTKSQVYFKHDNCVL